MGDENDNENENDINNIKVRNEKVVTILYYFSL